MHLTVVVTPDCPNGPILKDRLTVVLNDWPGISVSHEFVTNMDHASRWGMHGSPTLLIDGVDPFAMPGQLPGMSCRLYRHEDGQLAGAPSVSQLRQAVEQALATNAGQPSPLHGLAAQPRTAS